MDKKSAFRKKVLKEGTHWFKQKQWKPFPYQLAAWNHILDGKSGIINAPTGSGKTYSCGVGLLLKEINLLWEGGQPRTGLKIIWISPIRALTKEIQYSLENACEGLGLDWSVQIRSGDTSAKVRKQQLSHPPDVLITTPESIHVLLATANYSSFFKNLSAVVADEWHELMGSKRGVQTELAISRFKGLNENLMVWGISATIGNLEEAAKVLMGPTAAKEAILVKSGIKKTIALETILPDEIDNYPWAGHLGIEMLDKVISIILKNKSTLIFTNTRSQCEIWYQRILDKCIDLAGTLAMHHGSISKEIRDWVENAIHNEKLKAVVCTSSLDLGVDFRPVETIIQIGSPKGVSRFVQRAGRSGHQPNAVSKIYFLPTHSLEIVEGAALREAIVRGVHEERMPYIRSFDVLIQYLTTLAVSEGFISRIIKKEILTTHCFSSMTDEEWNWIIRFLQYGGSSLKAYDEYQKLDYVDGIFKVTNKRIAQRHRLNIGTIVSSVSMSIHFTNGKRLGTIEEWFISSLMPGDHFWFAGQPLELIRVKEMRVQVRKGSVKKARVPTWGGGRMPLSSMLTDLIKKKLYDYTKGIINEVEMLKLKGLLLKQAERSILPKENEFLIEYFETKYGFHLVMYPFEGMAVHEGMAALIAQRLSQKLPISLSIATNDYGFELLAPSKIEIDKYITDDLFATENLFEDIQMSINAVELGRRKFRDIAKISGLVFQGFPGNMKKERHLQSSSSLLFNVFQDFEPDNLLFLQTHEEVRTFQLEERRLRLALDKINHQKKVLSRPSGFTPFAFPIIVDTLRREKVSSEKLEDQVMRLLAGMGDK
ncbi:MAG: ligase-associated DNA damage response DEXH box helicase [Saprospiraceae bacterium]|nr:ligase-associated DNA damage response DEXH box helicase [Saprospiraceae bacterium]